jgi:hypothetical protein
MVKGILTAAVAGAIGFLAIIAGYMLLALHKWSGVMSNERLVALLLAPIVVGLAVGVGVYRILQR